MENDGRREGRAMDNDESREETSGVSVAAHEILKWPTQVSVRVGGDKETL